MVAGLGFAQGTQHQLSTSHDRGRAPPVPGATSHERRREVM